MKKKQVEGQSGLLHNILSDELSQKASGRNCYVVSLGDHSSYVQQIAEQHNTSVSSIYLVVMHMLLMNYTMRDDFVWVVEQKGEFRRFLLSDLGGEESIPLLASQIDRFMNICDVHSHCTVNECEFVYFTTENIDLDPQGTKVTITFCFDKLTIYYKPMAISDKSLQSLENHVLHLLDQFFQTPTRPIMDYEIITESERIELTEAFHPNANRSLVTKHVWDYIEKIAKEDPTRKAILFNNYWLTYLELNERANAFARYMLSIGLQKGEIVAIVTERASHLIWSILGLWKAGGVYLPIDPSLPVKRFNNILENSRVKLLIHDQSALSLFEYRLNDIVKINLESPLFDLSAFDNSNFNLQIPLQSLSYVIYTSGSTGIPKGAMVSHQGMMNHLLAKLEELHLKDTAVVAQNASQCFDISIWQMFSALIVGGKTVIISTEVIHNFKWFTSLVVQEDVTILEVVPSFLFVWIGYLHKKRFNLPKLKYLLVTGEVVKPQLIHRWLELYPQIKVVNAYGPTEASDDITHYIIEHTTQLNGPMVPIGRPIRNMKIYILDRYNKHCPIGAKGEICVVGDGVGEGYLFQVEKTAQVFVENPYKKENERSLIMYRTGDIGCWLSDGNILYFGRKDFQLKIRGNRIEPGDIENKLILHSQIEEVIVVDKEDAYENRYLCAYYIAAEKVDSKELIAFLKTHLPEYMIPSYFIRLEGFPLTLNGKIDRKLLPLPK